MKRISIKNISKNFKIGFEKRQVFWRRALLDLSGREPKKNIEVLKNFCLEAEAGEILGIAGPNGSGKSTLLRIIAGILESDSGSVQTNGRIISLINLGIGLRERLTMRQNIFLAGALFGMSRKEIAEKFDFIVEFSELGEFINTKVFQFSSGMLQRLTFSIAISADPGILLLDEVFELGDEHFREKSRKKIMELARQGALVVLVSHDHEIVQKYCSRVVYMKKESN